MCHLRRFKTTSSLLLYSSPFFVCILSFQCFYLVCFFICCGFVLVWGFLFVWRGGDMGVCCCLFGLFLPGTQLSFRITTPLLHAVLITL